MNVTYYVLIDIGSIGEYKHITTTCKSEKWFYRNRLIKLISRWILTVALLSEIPCNCMDENCSPNIVD